MSSDPSASPVAPPESRLTELEIKAAFTEDLLDRLNLLVYRQQEQIDRLIGELNQLRLQLPEDGPVAHALKESANAVSSRLGR